MRPTSVGNNGASGLQIARKREKNKALIPDFMPSHQNKAKQSIFAANASNGASMISNMLPQ